MDCDDEVVSVNWQDINPNQGLTDINPLGTMY